MSTHFETKNMLKRRETVMLCHNYDPNQDYTGWFMSEKCDGFRAIWDGGLSRGFPADQIPWANTLKHERYKSPIICSGLWSRLFQPIAAPDWFLNQLPPYCLDGELYCGVGKFQDTMSICKKLEPDDNEWRQVKYCIFDIPTLAALLKPGRINLPNFQKDITEDMRNWAFDRLKTIGLRPNCHLFQDVVAEFWEEKYYNDVMTPIKQYKIRSSKQINEYLSDIEKEGGEGLILRSPVSVWKPERNHLMLKMKSYSESEGIVVGYIAGKETNRGSKLLGLMGAMIVEYEYNGEKIQFELSGFTDEERQIEYLDSVRIIYSELHGSAFEAVENLQGKKIPNNIMTNPMFPIGTKIRFKYNGLSDNGIPRFARYWR